MIIFMCYLLLVNVAVVVVVTGVVVVETSATISLRYAEREEVK